MGHQHCDHDPRQALFSLSYRLSIIPYERDIASGIARVNNFMYFCNSKLIHRQLRSDWSAALPGCNTFNSHSSKLNIIFSTVTDVILLLTVLIGLIRLRSYGGGMFDMGRFLWKQVG